MHDQCAREKYWSELTDAERIQKLKREVERMQYYLERSGRLISRLIRHRHSGSDIVEVVSPHGEYVDELNFRKERWEA